MAKPKVIVKCVANAYTGPNERIIEFSDREVSDDCGGLISFRRLNDGRLLINVYRVSGPVVVSISSED